MYTPEASQLILPVRTPAKALAVRDPAPPLKFVLELKPMRQPGCTKPKSELICLPRLVSVPPPAPFVTETWADQGPSSRPPSTPSSDELKLVPVTWRMKALSSSMRSPNGTNIRPAFTYALRFANQSMASVSRLVAAPG